MGIATTAKRMILGKVWTRKPAQLNQGAKKTSVWYSMTWFETRSSQNKIISITRKLLIGILQWNHHGILVWWYFYSFFHENIYLCSKYIECYLVLLRQVCLESWCTEWVTFLVLQSICTYVLAFIFMYNITYIAYYFSLIGVKMLGNI